MTFKELLKNVSDTTVYGNGDIPVQEIRIDSRACEVGDLFVCVQGFVQDGNRYGVSAVRKGACGLVTGDVEALATYAGESGGVFNENGLSVDGRTVPVAVVRDLRKTLAHISATRWGEPSHKLHLIGITGTKGKTTTSYMLRSIFTSGGMSSGMVGTICNYIGEERIETERTTPEANVLQPLLARMVEAGIPTCVMEVSSQGLHLDRVGCCHFTTALFTNLSRDHIGASEHATMEEYALAKAKLFSQADRALLNTDNDWYEFMAEEAGKNPNLAIYTYGIEGNQDFCARNVETMPDGVQYDLYEKGEWACQVYVPIPGRFTVYNSLAAYGVARLEGLSKEDILVGLSTVFVPGKAEIVPTGRNFTILIDYAHNPDSFINILTTVKEFAKRTVFLFGCGGDRNRPRVLMGETAGQYADFTIITSDNPRSEDPESIVRDLEAGIKPTGAPYICIVDRREAIEYAIRNAQSGDVIILAGKGHETYQILKDRTIHFDERQVVAEVLEKIQAEENKL